jgi:hypothetical protein
MRALASAAMTEKESGKVECITHVLGGLHALKHSHVLASFH